MPRPGIREARPQAVPPPADLLLRSIVEGLKKSVSGRPKNAIGMARRTKPVQARSPAPRPPAGAPGPAVAATRVATTPRPHALPSWTEVLSRPAASPRPSSPVATVPAMVRDTFENMNPASPTTVPASTARRPPSRETPITRSSPATTPPRPRAAVFPVPSPVTSLPATAAATEARAMGKKRRPAASGP